MDEKEVERLIAAWQLIGWPREVPQRPDPAMIEKVAETLQSIFQELRNLEPLVEETVSPFHETPTPTGGEQSADAWTGRGEHIAVGRAAFGRESLNGSLRKAALPSGRQKSYLKTTLSALAEALHVGELSSTAIVDAFEARYHQVEEKVHAFTYVPSNLRATAQKIEQQMQMEGHRPLAALPIAVKELFAVTDWPLEAGSAAWRGRRAQRTAAAVRRLEEAGMLLVGQTASHEFAFGVTTDTPYHGPVHNPCDLTRSAGGSSGGSAAAVAAGMVPAALGTDTGGSVRIPAALCGVVGFKPTVGQIPVDGVVPLSYTQDHVGFLTRSVTDAALLYEVLTSVPAPAQDGRTLRGDDAAQLLSECCLLVPQGWLEEGVDPGILRAFTALLNRFGQWGISVRTIQMPCSASALALVNRVISMAEAARIHDADLRLRATQISSGVRLRLEVGSVLPAPFYLRALQLRKAVRQAQVEALRQARPPAGHAFFCLPTTPIYAPVLGQTKWVWPSSGAREPVADLLVRFTAPFSLTGLPALSLPFPLDASRRSAQPLEDSDPIVPTLPWGAQLVGLPGDDRTLLRLGHVLMQREGQVLP
ncbi:MAG: amidase [Firmicutes bacterium]|nr:amidase [Bacillota bacterium]